MAEVAVRRAGAPAARQRSFQLIRGTDGDGGIARSHLERTCRPVADGGAEVPLALVALDREVAPNVTVARGRVEPESGVGGQRQRDIAVARLEGVLAIVQRSVELD